MLLNIQRGANRVPEGLSEGGSRQGTRFGICAPFSFLFRIPWLGCRMRFSTGGCIPPSAARYFSQLPSPLCCLHPRHSRDGNLARLEASWYPLDAGDGRGILASLFEPPRCCGSELYVTVLTEHFAPVLTHKASPGCIRVSENTPSRQLVNRGNGAAL